MITSVVVKDAPGIYDVANAPQQGSFAVVRFAPQATFAEISNFLGAYKATVVEGPVKSAAGMYRIKVSDTELQDDEINKIVREMQAESKIVGFVAKAPPQSK